MDKDKKIWKAIWDSTDETVNYKDVFYLIDEIKLGYLMPLLPTGTNLKTLEVGCGSARLSCFLASKGYKTTCLDYSESALRVAKKNYKISNIAGNFVIGDAKQLPFENDTFDIVFSTGLLEHFKEPQIVIDEMVRVLKPNGIFYSDIVPKKFSTFRSPVIITKSLIDFLRKDENETFYEKKLNSKDIQKMLNSADLKYITVFGAGVFLPQIPHGKRIQPLKRLEYQFLSKIRYLFTIWDDTIVGDWLGFYYFVYAKK